MAQGHYVTTSATRYRWSDNRTKPRWKHLWRQHGITGGTLAGILARIWLADLLADGESYSDMTFARQLADLCLFFCPSLTFLCPLFSPAVLSPFLRSALLTVLLICLAPYTDIRVDGEITRKYLQSDFRLATDRCAIHFSLLVMKLFWNQCPRVACRIATRTHGLGIWWWWWWVGEGMALIALPLSGYQRDPFSDRPAIEWRPPIEQLTLLWDCQRLAQGLTFWYNILLINATPLMRPFQPGKMGVTYRGRGTRFLFLVVPVDASAISVTVSHFHQLQTAHTLDLWGPSMWLGAHSEHPQALIHACKSLRLFLISCT